MGDITQAAAQALDSSISSYDLTTILLQVHPQITTRKLVLVGHSQGSFYVNEMHSYLLAHGEPRAAVGVYQVATPAASVAGGGRHLTSSNDSVVNAARIIVTNANQGLVPLAAANTVTKREILPANITLSSANYGHSFSGTYLAEAPERIVGDIQGTIKNLKAEAATETGECFTAPNAGLGYQAAKAGFAVADTAALGVKAGAGAAQVAAVAAGNVLVAAAKGAYGAVTKLTTDIGITVGGVAGLTNAAEPQSGLTNFDIFSKLYGSSLNKTEIKELLGSAVASAPVFADTSAPQEEAQITPGVQVPKKITYLSGSHSSDNNNESQEEVEAPAEIVEPIVVLDEVVPAEPEPEPEPTPEPEPEPEPSPLLGTVIINELAWAGTHASPTDQWIELYNRAAFDVDLSALYLKIGDTAPVPLSGTLASGRYVILQRTGTTIKSIGFPDVVTVGFAPLSAEPLQVSLVLTDGTVIDATPAADACGGTWCAGGATTMVYADSLGVPTSVSMERIDIEDGTDPDNWANNDGYTRYHLDAAHQPIIGTPGNQNSKHWPLTGFFCGNEDVLTPGNTIVPYDTSGSCTWLMGGAQYWTSVGGSVFKGQVGSSTYISEVYFPGRFDGGNRKWYTAGMPALVPGEYFVAMWEYITYDPGFSANRLGGMYSYLKTGTPKNPGLSYVIIQFIVEGDVPVTELEGDAATE